MQTVSSNYETASKNTVRVPSQSVLVDWDNDHSFDDESENVIAIVVEKYIQEYLSSIYSAQADINLINSGDYTPIGEIPSILHTGDNDDYLNKASSQRKLAISSEGYYLSVMEDSGDTSVFFKVSKDGGITWSEAVTISNDGKNPSCFIDSSDNVHITYLNDAGTEVKYVKLTYSSGAWSVGTVREVQGVIKNVVDSYAYANGDSYAPIDNGTVEALYQAFEGDGSDLYKAIVYLKKVGTVSGNIVCSLYAMTGDYGDDGTPTGVAIETSSTTVTANNISTGGEKVEFNFAGTTELEDGVHYCLVLTHTVTGDTNNYIGLLRDSSSSSHAGNGGIMSSSTWYDYNGFVGYDMDFVFYVLNEDDDIKDEAYSNPIIYIAESDKVFVVFKCINYSTDYYIYSTYTENDGVAWDTRDDVTGDTDVKSGFNVGVSDDNLYVIWLNEDDSKIQYATYSNFGTPSDLQTGVSDTDVDISVASYDDIMVVVYKDGVALYLNIFDSTWGSQILVATDSDGYDNYNVCISDGNVYIPFYVTDSEVVRYIKVNLTTEAISERIDAYEGVIGDISCLEAVNTNIVPFSIVDDNTVYFCGLTSNAQYNFRPGVESKIAFGFGAEDKLQVFRGLSELPNSNMKDKKYSIHLYDEIKKLQDYTLPQGELYADIRTDDYVGKILKEYWGTDNYEVISDCESDDNWSRLGDTDDFEETIDDSYDETSDADWRLYSGYYTGLGQSFESSGGILKKCRWNIKKWGSPTGNAVAKIYAITGTFGSTSKPTGSALATSDNFDVSTISNDGNFHEIEFTFSGAEQIELSAGYYCVTIEYSGGDVSNYINIELDRTSSTHSGNASSYSPTFWSSETGDFLFAVYVKPDDNLDNTDFMEGSGSIVFNIDVSRTIDNYAGLRYEPTAIDLSRFYGVGKFRLWVYLSTVEYISNIQLNFGTDTSNYLSIEVESDFAGNDFRIGWNLVEFDWQDAIATGNIDITDVGVFDIIINYTGDQDDAEDFRIDELVCYKPNIPVYYHDKGLNILGLAWFEGNKAAYEIKTACDAEGARFYQSEQGYLVFENRQHYIVNEEHKSIVHRIDFNNATEFNYVNDFNNIINYVEMAVEPRKLQSLKVIWNYGEVPLAFTAGETKTIWASLEDPCSSITDPASTTDYTANVQEDGGGADKTAQISIDITKFAKAAKMDITNNDAGTVYLTFLQLRGTPYEKQGKVLVISENKVSQRRYGLKKNSSDVSENKYFQNSEDVQTLADMIIEIYAQPSGIISFDSRCLPQLQIGDLVSVLNNQTNTSFIQRIIGIKISYNENGLNFSVITRRVLQTELLDYFTINVSSIAGDDIIAP